MITCIIIFYILIYQDRCEGELHTKIYGTNMAPSNGALCQTSYCLLPRYDNIITRQDIRDQYRHENTMTTDLRHCTDSATSGDLQRSRDQSPSHDLVPASESHIRETAECHRVINAT